MTKIIEWTINGNAQSGMTNLEYLACFLEDTYGAICFHNDSEDGYIKYSEKDGKQMETLAVYFANELDLTDEIVAKRLTKKAGKDFYKRYAGARGIRLSPVYSNILFSRYSVEGRTITILGETLPFIDTGLNWIMDYFIGRNIDYRIFDEPHNKCLTIPTNNDFCLRSGDDIKITLEKYLREHKLPRMSYGSNFYVSPFNYCGETEYRGKLYKEIVSNFGDIAIHCTELGKERRERFRKTFRYMTKSDWENFFRARGCKRKNLGTDSKD